MDFTILGRTQMFVGGNSIYLGTAKQRALLALLLIHVGRPVPVNTITQQLWDGRVHEQIRGNLQSRISRLRAALKNADELCVIHTVGGAYLLDTDPQRIDIHRFRRQVELARAAMHRGEHAAARLSLIDTLQLWRGSPLLDLQSDWAVQRREQLEKSELLPAQQSLIECELKLGEHAMALSRLSELMDGHPDDETLAVQWIQALDGLGRVGEVTTFAARHRQRVLTELGAEPGPVFRAVLAAVLQGRTTPAPAVGASRSGPAAPPERRQTVWRLSRGTSDLVGRDVLMAELDGSFFGRGAELPAPVVALYGMPGVGKTSLALYWGHRRRPRFQGALSIDLNGFGQGPPVTAEDAMAVILGDLGVPADQVPANGEQRRAALGRHLAGRNVLLVIDNVPDSTHVRPLLLAAGSSCPVLLTSRSRLDGLAVREGMRAILVPPLSTVDSMAMLRSELGQSRAGDDPAVVAEIADLTGGLPLMLKVIGQHAANRPRTPLADVIRGLGGRTGLVSSSAGADDETATPAGAFGLSYAALPDETATLFRALGAHHAAAFTVCLAASLVGRPVDEVDHHLQILARDHLLEPDGIHRYRFHDLIHDYAGVVARRDETPEDYSTIMARMADWYLGTATNAVRLLMPHGQPVPPMTSMAGVWPQSFDTEDDALHWCVQERGNVIAAARRAAEHGLHDRAWRIPATVGQVFERAGHFDDFLDILKVAITSARAIEDGEAEIGLLNFLGSNYLSRHRYRDAQEHFRIALDLAEELGHLEGKSASRHNLASAHLQLGDVDAAIEIYGLALEQDRETGDRDGEAYALHQLGSAFRRLGRYETAIEHYQEALRIWYEIGDVSGQGDTLTNLGSAHYARGDHDQAIDYCLRALRMHDRSQARVRYGQTLTILASVHHDVRRFYESVEYAERAVELCEITKDSLELARALHALGHGLYAVGDQAPAVDRWARALELVEARNGAEAAVLRSHLDAVTGNGTAPLSPSAGCVQLRRQLLTGDP